MTERTDTRYEVALQGFSDFERGALSSFLRLSAARTPSYLHVDLLDQADFVIADSDHEVSVDAVVSSHRTADTVFVGGSAPEGAMAWLPRPIDPMQILRELDALVAQRQPGVFDSLGADVDAALRPGDPDDGRPDVLVVEDSAIARRFLQRRLERLGYRVHLARDGEQAMERLRARRFAIVFLDVVLGEPGSVDGLTLCKRIKQRPEFSSDGGSKVVMVSGMCSEIDKVRGTLAGCDAYLGKPLTDEHLLPALHRIDESLALRIGAIGSASRR